MVDPKRRRQAELHEESKKYQRHKINLTLGQEKERKKKTADFFKEETKKNVKVVANLTYSDGEEAQDQPKENTGQLGGDDEQPDKGLAAASEPLGTGGIAVNFAKLAITAGAKGSRSKKKQKKRSKAVKVVKQSDGSFVRAVDPRKSEVVKSRVGDKLGLESVKELTDPALIY